MSNTRKITVMAMLAAISIILVYLIHFPIFPSAPFLEYDPADIPILIGAFAFGPVSGLVLTVIASLIQAVTVSASSGAYGFIMHIIPTGTMVLVAGGIYKIRHTRVGALIGLVCGIVAWGAVMMVANHFITPAFTGWPTEQVDALLLPIILPFNLIKASVNAFVTFLLYKTVSTYVIKNEGLLMPKDAADKNA